MIHQHTISWWDYFLENRVKESLLYCHFYSESWEDTATLIICGLNVMKGYIRVPRLQNMQFNT